MGNTDSQYSSFNVPGKSKSCSLKFYSAKEEALSPHSWWRGSEGSGQGYRTRGKGGRVCLPQHKITHNQPYGSSKHYEHHITREGDSSQVTRKNVCHTGYSYLESSGESVSGLGANGQRTPERTSPCEHRVPLESRSSPKVLLRKDGSMRVEFTNAMRMSLEPQDLSGHSHPVVAAPEPSLTRTSKGSSLSSEGSWYDSPWGNPTELNDNVGIGDSMILHPEKSPFSLMSPPVSLSDLYSNPSVAAVFPAAQFQDVPQQRGSLTSLLTLDAVIQEESSGSYGQRYSSHSRTLPCRRVTATVASEPSAIVVGNSRKDNLKSRIRRLGDWTGSLSRKKRRLQEPYGSETSEGCSSGVDPGLGNSSSQLTGPLWNPLHTQAYTHTQGQQCHSDALRQNIYENFMQELETGRNKGEQGESSGSGSLGSLEQLDLLFEKEQGVVRRAGWLYFKPILTLHKDRKLELVARRKWRQYWVTLKGCTLLFYETYGKSSCPEQELSPRYALLAEDSIVQAVPEHPKKENVFCLSNAYGDVYLFQAANQTDLENWVTAIHSASASLLAKRQGKEDTVRLLRSQTRVLLQKIDMDSKMKKMAELQLSVISDQRNRKAIESQIQQWEQNLEKFHMDLFRMRCYLASLQGGELPNPKSLLAVAGRPSKTALGRLGIFSVSSFHALICTRDEATLRRRCRSFSRGARSKRGLFSSLKGLDSLTKRSKEKRESVSQVLYNLPRASLHPSYNFPTTLIAPPEGNPWYSSLETPVCVNMPDSQSITLHIKPDFLVSDLLSLACKVMISGLFSKYIEVCDEYFFNLLCAFSEQVYEELEVFPLNVFTIQLSRPDTAVDFGLRAGDEILVLNGTSVSNLDLGLIHLMFNHQILHLLLRREEQVPGDHTSVWPDCDPWQPGPPPPPSHGVWPIGRDYNYFHLVLIQATSQRAHSSLYSTLLLTRTFPEGRGAVVVEGQRNPYSMEPLGPQVQKPPCPRHMSISERLCKVIQELVDTEKSYVKDLGCLFDIYLTPLQSETFLSHDEMESLFGSLPEMLDFQRVFLHTLEERIASSPNFSSLETPEQFKKLLFSLGGSFLYYADHFKLYSGFCANHIKVQKVLERAKTDRAFKEFLEARNPTKQHSSTLESYLIKPVQRVLKYPLLLRELVSLTDPESEEHSHLTEALRAMEKVASHINEMQKIYEDYGTVFDQLVAEQSGPEKEVTEISMGEFLIHSSLKWLNPLPSLCRMRKDPELTVFVFKRAVILVYRESSKMRKRMTTSRSDLDPFKFRWLIPVSAVQVRPGNTAGAENPCVWELVHTKSQVEGRPETVFQLCSSGLENKASVVKALRSLRDCTRRPLLPERGSREHLGSLRRTQPAPVRDGSWRRRQQRQSEAGRTAGHQHHSDDSSVSSGGLNPGPGETHTEPQLPSRSSTGLPSLEGTTLGKRAWLCSLTSTLEAQLQRLNFTEEAGPRSTGTQQEHLIQGVPQPHPAVQKRVSSLQGGQGRQDNDSQCVDFNTLLGRDFSVQSLNSVVNEDCFYDTVMGIQKAAIPTL
uniref:TIAM Rac1 associated GEF 2 n=1 Tax=Oncorhynchus mykiss TaxID=8022 RepID=A0A8K9WXH4_ONCMY